MGHRLGCLAVAAALFVGILVAAGGPASPPSGLAATRAPDLAPLGWTMVLDENFTGAQLDSGLWYAERDNAEDGDDDTDKVVRTPEAVGLASSCPGDPAAGCLTVSTWTEGDKQYTGGIRSGTGEGAAPFHNGFAAASGYVEARINFTNQSGTNSAFWMLPNTNGSPFGDPAGAGPEIDIAEHQNALDVANSNTINLGLHWDGYGLHHRWVTKRVTNPTATPLQANFHTYGLLWSPSGYRIYIDGNEVWQRAGPLSYQPEHLLLTSAINPSPGFAGLIPSGGYGSKATTTNKMIVDYVRVWQRPVSDISNQHTTAGVPLSVPFTVTNYFSQARATAPRTVVVTATTRPEDQVVLPNSRVVVTGNSPADPDGSFTAGGFDCCWSITGDASISGEQTHTGGTAMRLGAAGGRAEQHITNLRPQTTYAVDGWFNLTAQPGKARVGVVDVDGSTSGNQPATHLLDRNSSSTWYDGGWSHDMLTFTTGPDTTAVTLFVDNLDAGMAGSRVPTFVDDFLIRPVVSPHRTVTMLPVAGVTGRAVVTLTATAIAANGQSQTLGTESFTIDVSAGSLVNAGFESGATGWYADATAIVPEDVDPATADEHFQSNDLMQILETGGGAQRVTGLKPQTSYTVRGRGRLETAAQRGSGILVAEYDASRSNEPLLAYEFTSTQWSEGAVTFTTGPLTEQAVIYVADFTSPGGITYFDDLSIRPAGDRVTAAAHPALTSIGPRRMTSSKVDTVAFTSPVGIARARSDNPHLLPDSQIGLTAGGPGDQALSFSPTPDRTGVANVSLLDASGNERHRIPVFVSDGRLQPMQLGAGSQASQTVSGLDYDTIYVLGARITGQAVLEVRDYDATRTDEPPVTKSISGTGGTLSYLTFTMPPDDNRCTSNTTSATVVIRSTNPATPAVLHDAVLFRGPTLTPLPEWSVHEGETGTDWTAMNDFTFGSLPHDAGWDPGQLALTSSNSNVAPLNLLSLDQIDPTWPSRWGVQIATPGGVSGRSDIGVWAIDPTTGAVALRNFRLTVNAGTTFTNGDFELGTHGWMAYPGSGIEVEPKQKRQCGAQYRHPDYDRVLRVSSGAIGTMAEGLLADTPYVLRGWGKGSGSVVQVLTSDWDVLGSRPINSTAGADFAPISFRTPPGDGPVSVWVVIGDVDPLGGTAYIDDLGLFAA